MTVMSTLSVYEALGERHVSNTRWLCFVFPQAQFGRRWTKVAKLVGSRSVLQVKSYARQYFKQKV